MKAFLSSQSMIADHPRLSLNAHNPSIVSQNVRVDLFRMREQGQDRIESKNFFFTLWKVEIFLRWMNEKDQNKKALSS